MVKTHSVIAITVLAGALAAACGGSSSDEPAAGTGGAGVTDAQAGGTTATGGSSATGGASGSGGAAGSGGASTAGGMPGTGGMPPVLCGGVECPIQLPTTCCAGNICGVEDDMGVCVDPLAGLRDGGTELEPIVTDPACGMVSYTAFGATFELPGCCDVAGGMCGGNTAELPEVIPGLSLPISCLTPQEFASLTFQQQPGASTPCGPDAGPPAEAGAVEAGVPEAGTAEAGTADASDASSD